MRTAAIALLGLVITMATPAEAVCTKETGRAVKDEIGGAAKHAFKDWLSTVKKDRGPSYAAKWYAAKDLSVTCNKVISGSGPGRGPRWACDAVGFVRDAEEDQCS